MGFIFGIVNWDKNAVTKEEIQKLADAVKWEHFNSDFIQEGNVALGVCNHIKREPQAAIYKEGELLVVADIKIYNTEELKKEIDFTEDTEAFVRAYQKWGIDCANHINGDFSVVVVDRSKNQITLFRDHIGVRPLCYYSLPDKVFFASHEFGLARSGMIDCKLCEDKLIRSFYYITKKHKYRYTIFQNIFKVCPGFTLTITSNICKERQYWFPEKIKKERHLTFDDTVKQLRKLLIDSTMRRMNNDLIGVHVSGGLDSSGIAAILSDLIEDKDKLIGYSWSPEKTPDKVEGIDEKALIEDFSREKRLKIRYMSIDKSSMLDDYTLPEFENMSIEHNIMKQAYMDNVSLMYSGWGGDEFVSLSLRGSLNHIIFRFKLLALFRWIRTFGIKSTISRIRYEILPLLAPFGLFERNIMKRNTLRYFKKRFVIKYWKLFFFNKKKNIYGYGDRNGMMLKLLHNYHLPERMDSWALFGEKYGLEYRYPLLDKKLLEFWFTVPIKHTYEKMGYRLLYRDAMKGILNEKIRMRTNKDEFVYRNHLLFGKKTLHAELFRHPEWFREIREIPFLKAEEFEKLTYLDTNDRHAFKLLFYDLFLFLRYKRLSEKYFN